MVETMSDPPSPLRWCTEHSAQAVEGPLGKQFDECWKQVYAEGSDFMCRIVENRWVDREAIDYEWNVEYNLSATEVQEIVDAALRVADG